MTSCYTIQGVIVLLASNRPRAMRSLLTAVIQMEDNHMHEINCKTNGIFTALPALRDHQTFLTSNF